MNLLVRLLLIGVGVADAGAEDLPLHGDDLAVVRKIVQREGLDALPVVNPATGWPRFPGVNMVRFSASLRPGHVLAAGHDQQGRVTHLAGNGPLLSNEAFTWIAALPELRVVRIDHNIPSPGSSLPHDDYDGAGLEALVNSKIQDLRITGAFADAGMKHLARIRLLQSIDIFHTRVTDEGIAHLENHPSLQDVRFAPMGSPRVTNRSLRTLATLPKIKRISLNKGLRMSWNGIWDVRIANPEWAALNLRMLVVTGKIGRAVAAGDEEAVKMLQQEREQVLKELSEYNGTRWVLFDRLFRADTEDDAALRKNRAAQTGSVLDAVRDQARRLHARLGKGDQQKLDEYFHSIREVEKQIDTDLAWLDKPKPQVSPFDFGDKVQALDPELQNKTNFDYRRYQRLMFDVITLALQTDSTRIVNYYARRDLNDGTHCYHYKGCPYNYHEMTHHGENPDMLAWLTKVDTWYMEEWAYFIERLKSVREGDGTLLDHTLLVWGSTGGTENAHNNNNLPTMLAGGHCLGVRHHGHLIKSDTRLGNLWQTIFDLLGVPVSADFQGGEADGVIRELMG